MKKGSRRAPQQRIWLSGQASQAFNVARGLIQTEDGRLVYLIGAVPEGGQSSSESVDE